MADECGRSYAFLFPRFGYVSMGTHKDSGGWKCDVPPSDRSDAPDPAKEPEIRRKAIMINTDQAQQLMGGGTERRGSAG